MRNLFPIGTERTVQERLIPGVLDALPGWHRHGNGRHRRVVYQRSSGRGCQEGDPGHDEVVAVVRARDPDLLSRAVDLAVCRANECLLCDTTPGADREGANHEKARDDRPHE